MEQIIILMRIEILTRDTFWWLQNVLCYRVVSPLDGGRSESRKSECRKSESASGNGVGVIAQAEFRGGGEGAVTSVQGKGR